MKHGDGNDDVERQISMQGIHLGAFVIILGKETEALSAASSFF